MADEGLRRLRIGMRRLLVVSFGALILVLLLLALLPALEPDPKPEAPPLETEPKLPASLAPEQ